MLGFAYIALRTRRLTTKRGTKDWSILEAPHVNGSRRPTNRGSVTPIALIVTSLSVIGTVKLAPFPFSKFENKFMLKFLVVVAKLDSF